MHHIELKSFDDTKLKEFRNFKPEALEAILNHLVFYFNDNIDAYVFMKKNDTNLMKIVGQGMVFNFFIIEQMIKTLGIKNDLGVDPNIKLLTFGAS